MSLKEIARPSSPARPVLPDAVDICLRDIGKIKVNDTGEFFDIDALARYL